MKGLLIITCLFLSFGLLGQDNASTRYRQDFDFFWTTVNDNYCYWNKKQTDWQKVRAIYEPLADTVTTKENFIGLLEKAFYELYDHHASLNTNTAASRRLVPSGTDIWAEYVKGIPLIKEVKRGSGAENCGLRPGMQIEAMNDAPIERAIQSFLPLCLARPDDEAENYALRLVLAGNHSGVRKITIIQAGKQHVYYPDQPVNLLEEKNSKNEIESKILKGNIGYIVINNSLGDEDLVRLFDSVLTKLEPTSALILDLRNTPSGGITTVARAIIGRFISKEGLYQKHELSSEEKETGIKRSWVEIVSPRKPFYRKPLIVLADHWTGSVGEGIVIGFDALKRATIIGTPMAGLNGAIYSFKMPNTGIGFSFPAEKIFHVNGTPREDFHPAIEIDPTKERPGEDYILQQAMKYVAKHSLRQ